MKKVLCLGDISLDTYSTGESFFGGCALNCFRHLDRNLEREQVCLYAPVGNDKNSEKLMDFLSERKFNTRLKIIAGELPRQPIKIKEDGDRVLHDYHAGVLPNFKAEDSPLQRLSSWDIICFAYFKEVEQMIQSLPENLHQSSMLACDFGNLSDYDGNLTHTYEFLKKLSFAQFSSENKNLKERQDFFTEVSSKLPIKIIDSHGPNGASLYLDGMRHYFNAPQILEVVDTTGAGDCLFAHFIFHHFVSRTGPIESLRLSVEAATTQVMHLGPGPAEPPLNLH